MKGFTVIGHIAIDRVITDNGEYVQLGGPPCFASALGKNLGFQVDVVTKIGSDFPKELETTIRSLGIIELTRSRYPTTRFVLDYRVEPRVMSIPSVCEPIKPDDVNERERLLICPIVDEISDTLITQIDTSFLALDPQGLVRHIEKEHKVKPKKWLSTNVLEKLDLLKTSSNEHYLITGLKKIEKSLLKMIKIGVKVAVITDGSNGSYVMSDSRFFRVPVYSVRVVDSTGAGDCFIAGLTAFFDEGVEWACSVASAASSAIVETHGPIISCDKTEIMRRAEQIQDRIQRLD